MNKGANNNYINAVKKPPISKIILAYEIRKSCKKIIVFVEGLTDKEVYKILLGRDKTILVKFPGDLDFIVCGCKQSLLRSLEFLLSKYKNFKKNKNVIFIADRDYDDLNQISYDVRCKCNLTKYYSIENYFCSKENINKILKKLCFSQSEVELFNNSLNQFVKDILIYEVILCMKVRKLCNYDLTLLTDEIENCKCNDEGYIKFSDYFISQLETIKKDIYRDNYSAYQLIYNFLKEDYLYMKGHDLESFINEQLKHFKISENLNDLMVNSSIINDLSLEIDIIK